MPSIASTMVAKHSKKGFKTTVSIVSSNVFQKVVTIKNPCSNTASAPPPPPEQTRKHPPTEVRLPPLQEDLCCRPSVPLTITINDEDAASELSCEFGHYVEDRPPTPRPNTTIRKTLRNFCLPEPPQNTCGLPNVVTHSMEWPSDEEQDNEAEEDINTLAQFLPAPKLESVCGLQFWSPTPVEPTPNSWGLMIADRDDEDEGRFSTSIRDDDGSTHEYREPMVTMRDEWKH